MQKTYYRNIYRKERDAIPEKIRALYSSLTLSHIKNSSLYKVSDSIFIFVSMGSEIQTIDWIPQILKERKRVYIPYIEKGNSSMYMTEIYSLDELEENSMGLHQIPKELLEERIRQKVDLVFTPGLAFDNQGFRLGYGGGFYDRFFSLNKYNKAIGVGFSLQKNKNFPHGNYDIPIDGFFSEKGFESFI